MQYQATFERYEIKYLLSPEEKEQLLKIMAPYMKLDDYGRTTIRTIYYNTDNFRLIRRAIEKPAYKEKLRIRSYQQARPDDPVFVELKKKYDGIVYKRRVALPEAAAMENFDIDTSLPLQSQIADEIEYFRSYYHGFHPQVLITYERDAYYDLSGNAFRVTFGILADYASDYALVQVKTTNMAPLSADLSTAPAQSYVGKGADRQAALQKRQSRDPHFQTGKRGN